jgi:hypothetical protein
MPSRAVQTLRSWLAADECAAWVAGVVAARAEWTSDFDGEQFSLGRAFYTHLEQDASRAYFDDAAASDARVEAHVPGLQAHLRDLVASLVGGHAHARRRWCGPGVHIFPAGGHVARHGGVVHFDTEGLSAHHIARRRAAITAVVMLAPPDDGGGLRVWDAVYDGRDEATDAERAAPSVVVPYAAGDVVVIDSYRLHQIQPFGGARDRISATVHAAEIDPGRWETWF